METKRANFCSEYWIHIKSKYGEYEGLLSEAIETSYEWGGDAEFQINPSSENIDTLQIIAILTHLHSGGLNPQQFDWVLETGTGTIVEVEKGEGDELRVRAKG